MSPTACGQPEDNGIVSVRAGVDWVTVIADGREKTDALVAAVVPLGRLERAAGAPVKPFRFMGYEGQQCGAVRLGFKGADAVAQLSGELCNDSWTSLVSCGGRTTRLDLQTTVRLSASLPEFGRRLLKASTTSTRRRPQYRPRIAYSSDTSGLAIGTVGRRTNAAYARVYDKGIEQKSAPLGTLWRVELEAKQHLAGSLWQMIQTAEDVPAWCYGICESQWKSWGLRWRLPASSDLPAIPRAPGKRVAPAHTLAAWLRSSVSPTLPRVLTMYTVAELLEMLGIDHLARPREEGPNDGES